MNPFALLGTITSRYRDIQRAIALYKSIQPEVTELIELGTDLGRDFGLIDQQTVAQQGMPSVLRKYDMRWFQKNLNLLMNANLAVDGNIGPDGSETRKAVAAYQEKKKGEGFPTIVVDGIPGIQTAYMMETDLTALESPKK